MWCTVRSQSQLQAHLFERRGKAASFRQKKKCFPGYSWVVCYVQEGDGQATCSSRIAKTSRTCEPPMFTSICSSTKKSHKRESCFSHVQTDLSNFSSFVNPHAAKCPPGEAQSKMKKKKKQRGRGYFFLRKSKKLERQSATFYGSGFRRAQNLFFLASIVSRFLVTFLKNKSIFRTVSGGIFCTTWILSGDHGWSLCWWPRAMP